MGVELAMSELPLALFSTLAPMGAGAFLIIAAAFFTSSYDEAVTRKIDQLTVIPIIITCIGFICAFFHLANPFNAFGVFNNIGSSPMSNEILVGCIFMVVAIVCWLILLLTKPGEGAHKGLMALTAVVGLIFCLFIGMAYGMPTIPSWDIVVVPLATLCFGLLGGTAVGFVVLKQSGAAGISRTLSTFVMVIAIVGAVGSIVFFGIQMIMVNGMVNNVLTGEVLVGDLMPMIIAAVVLLFIAGALVIWGVMKDGNAGYLWICVVIVFVAVLLARLCFYGVELSVGLGL